MASRGRYDSPVTGPPGRGEPFISGSSRRLSATSISSTTSKIPAYKPSFFSRGKSSKSSLLETQPKNPQTKVPTKNTVGNAQRPVDAFSSENEPARSLPPLIPPSRSLGITAATNSSASVNVSDSIKIQANVLRRKPSSSDQHARYARTESSVSPYEPGRRYETTSSPGGFKEPFTGSVLGLALPAISSSTSHLPRKPLFDWDQATSSSRMASFRPELAPHSLSTHNLPPPTPSFGHSSSSSTRRSDSPGSLSRISTPTSMSSHSPSITSAAKSSLRPGQPSPSRPPVTRRRIMNLLPESDSPLSRDPGLAPVRESRASSSSSSTIKGTERGEGIASRVHLAPSNPLHLQSSQRNLKPPSKLQHPSRTSQTSDPERLALQRQENSQNSPEGLDALDPNPPITAQPNRALHPPPRPSREGTPKLDNGTGPSPVIRSNLSRLITTGHKRRESVEKTLSSLDDKAEWLSKSRPTLRRSPSNTSSLTSKLTRLPSPHPGSGVPSRPRLPELPRTGDVPISKHGASSAPIKEESPLKAVTVKSSARFGLFTRRNKSPLEFAVADPSERSAKKGPAAGTGHEGYGKYARRGRSGSASTSASRGRSTSTSATSNSLARTPTSRKSSITSRGEPEVDDFLLERLTPVVISGGGGIAGNAAGHAELDQTTSEEASSGRPSHEGFESRRTITAARTWPAQQPSTANINNPNLARQGSRVLADGAHPLKPITSPLEIRSIGSVPRPTLAARRSLHRSQLFKEAEPLKVPAPINTKALAPAAALDSYDTTLSAALRTDSTNHHSEDISEGREGNWLRKKKSARLLKSPMKWNFFQRSHAASKRTDGAKPHKEEQTLREVAVTVARLPESRSVAHYALLDNNDPDDTNSVGNLISGSLMGTHNANSVPIPREHETDVHKQAHKYSMLLPSPPNLSAEFASKLGPPSPMVNLRPLEHTLTSLPLAQSAPRPREPRLQQVGRIPRVISKRDHLHIPAPQSFSRPFARAPVNTNQGPSATEHNVRGSAARPILGVQTELIPYHPWGDEGSAKPASAPILARQGFDETPKDEFLAFPPRKDSQISASSSSGGLSFAAAPPTVQPIIGPGEDEVWNEYDEFLDTVQSSDFFKRNTGSHKGDKLKKGGAGAAPLLIRRDSAAIGSAALRFKEDMDQAVHVPTLDLPDTRVISNILSPLQSAEMTSTPLSFSDFFAGYGDRNRFSKESRRESASSGSHYSTRSRTSGVGLPHSGENENRKEDTEMMASKKNRLPSAQSNLRFSALMTSRWLSFGRVLFSPAHTEIQTNRQGRVLVLDGLGNDDWSFYCALTYPNATVYNLSPFQGTSITPARRHELVGYDSPTNHRQIYHTSIAHPFPFPKGFFTAAVFRFPVASSEAACYNAISECKRILRPGGFLEMSILDLDMVNMGNRARRAVRMLKVQMQVVDPEVSLKPASDNIQKMLGRRGFENLNRCMVNVPIAGHISDSRAGSADERDLSLGDMLKDSSEQGDEGITKMVAKVGRWWYTRCYERNVLPPEDMERSIWADRALLRECEKRETGLKLLICYAQKPLTPKRRTVSM